MRSRTNRNCTTKGEMITRKRGALEEESSHPVIRPILVMIIATRNQTKRKKKKRKIEVVGNKNVNKEPANEERNSHPCFI